MSTDNSQSFIARTSGLKTKDYIGYALGDTACCLVFGLVTSLLQKYYTDILLINPLWIMIMMVVARVWDAVNDPIMGRVVDTVKPSKYGRFRPWFLYSAIPLVVCSILMLVKWPGMGNNSGEIGTFVYATITYILFGMAYTTLQIPYGSLASVVTTDEKERTKLSIWRSVGAGVGGLPVLLISSFCYTKIKDANGDEIIDPNTGKAMQQMDYKIVIIGAVVLALVAGVMLFLAFKFNKERVPAAEKPKAQKGETARAFKKLFKDRAFLAISIASLLLLAAQMFNQSFYLYLFDKFFHKNWMNLVAQVCTYAPMVVLMFFTPKLVRKFGKKEICAVGAFVAAGANLVLFLCGLNPTFVKGAWWLFLLLTLVAGFGMTFMVLQVWAMVTDSIDNIEVKTGNRDDGTAYSFFMFFRKLGQVVAAVAVNGALLGFGYSADNSSLSTLTDTQLNTMYYLGTIIPA
ncbi:MAG: glycoside-pentoside-hexuronide (GPH):cation symporter, partial [Clostridia bacterium]|nr:glycoside-pentoside-hexuronide (GPH):cation symporter [Clostridia bacterium]